METLFENASLESNKTRPLADRLRPKDILDVVGQDRLIGDNGSISKMIKIGKISSMILWGPPGCGKTTIARLLANYTDLDFVPLSAIFSGVADLRKIFETAKLKKQTGMGTLLFVDEIHRFNKSQQDAFLPYVEDGTIILIGATTENPSFELNSALLSRCQVMVLNRLDDKALDNLILRAETELEAELPLNENAKIALKAMADGDGRYLLTMIEQIYNFADGKVLNRAELSEILQKRSPIYDKGDDGHYNLISALHKSVRGSDPDAALYWFARMLKGGEDPNFIARRLVRMAVEDICLADPNALTIANNAWQAYERLGSPEGELALANAVVYLATAPKSISAYVAFKASMDMADKTGSLMPPKRILNAPTAMMQDIGYGDGYQYDPDLENSFSGQNYFPDEIERQKFYKPVERGFEREISKRLKYWEKLRKDVN